MSLSALYEWDSLGFAGVLDDAERQRITTLRSVLESEVRPLVDEAWAEGVLPSGIVKSLAALRLLDPLPGTTDEVRPTLTGFRNFEMARTDASIATIYNAHAGLFRTAVKLGTSADRFAAMDPALRDFSHTGAFALTEPDHGSDIARGIATTAERTANGWVINGQKRWIGGALTAHTIAVFAREVGTSGQVLGFLVPAKAPGISMSKIERKTSLRIVQNADITLNHVEVPESARLELVQSFDDVSAMLRVMRSDVAWVACGAMAGAYEAAVAYTTERKQFGRQIAAFQLVQEKLARIRGNLLSSLALTAQLSKQQDAGIYLDADSALTKMITGLRLRESVALAREVVGGNGITLDTGVSRFHADAEGIYTYEGTHEINALIVGRSITGASAFI